MLKYDFEKYLLSALAEALRDSGIQPGYVLHFIEPVIEVNLALSEAALEMQIKINSDLLQEIQAIEQKMHPTDGGLPASDNESQPATIGG